MNKTITRITLSSEARCALAKHCYPIRGNEKSQQAWCEARDLFVANDRVFVLVDTTNEIFFMDAVTGTLYQFGECLTNPNFKHNSFVRNNNLAKNLLKERSERIKFDNAEKEESENG